MINERVKYTANTGVALISTANSNLDGTGTIGTVLTGSSNGTFIKTVTIKAIGNTTRGMIRLYISDGTKIRIIEEIKVPAVTKSGIDSSFSYTIPMYYNLKSGYILCASTQNAESFSIIANGLNWAY